MTASSSLSYCLVQLKRRLRSRHELEQTLHRRGTTPEDQAAVLIDLETAGLIDDHRFALAWIHDRDRFRPRGASLLRSELIRKGIAKELIDQVLRQRFEQAVQEEEEQPTEEELARRLLAGKERLYASLSPEVRQRRAMALLLRHGFSYEVIRRILEA